ncbi:MAG TPA: hypothetical protein ENH38_06635 [Nitrospirae bacterium]|nr:hypothetical protein [Nitrospirota bacterium]
MKEINRLLPGEIAIKNMIFIDRSMPSLSSFIDCYEYQLKFTDVAPVNRFSESNGNDHDLKSIIIDSVIIDNMTVKIKIKETADTKIKLAEIVERAFDMKMENISIIRTGMWGLMDRPMSPMEISIMSGKGSA